MKLTVLGKYGPYPGAGGACSGYLVENEGTRVLIDCGSGVLSRLQQICGIEDLDGVILSHLHGDHMSDMMILRYALDIQTARGLYNKGPLPVCLPGNPPEEYQRIASAQVFEPIVIESGMEISLGSLKFTFEEMTHPVQSFAVAVSNGTKHAVYTGDTNYNDKIAAFARDADFFWADTGLLERDLVKGKSPHLSADEVGKIAAEAGVKALMLSHIWPGYDEKELAGEAGRHYRNLFVAEEIKSYNI
jgi:ribonuclease BN (tRNA processing enzyme)